MILNWICPPNLLDLLKTMVKSSQAVKCSILLMSFLLFCLSCLSSIRTHISSARLRTRHKNLLSLLILSYPGRHCAPLPNFGYISKKLSTDLKQPTQWINPSHFGLTSLATPDSASTFAHGDSSKHIDAGAQHWLASGSCDASESWESSEPSTFTA